MKWLIKPFLLFSLTSSQDYTCDDFLCPEFFCSGNTCNADIYVKKCYTFKNCDKGPCNMEYLQNP
jgi:hypothetical protein